ncbi:MAG: methylated-DNA--[protein]-cysteine S-methyltransferase [Treponema sp.]|nr:methylated-DNA--[protein]-cysteine S-methyltransferase [Treponema sp.]
MKSVFFYDYPAVSIGIAEEDGKISGVFFGTNSPAGFDQKETPLIAQAAGQLSEYFNGGRKTFDLPLLLRGTDFQRSVWEALQTIPFGETCSYGKVAVRIGKPKAVRAVGMANNRNPIVIIIPCHRVIGQDGSLTGYGGGLPLKQFLLDMEQGKPAAH